MTPAATHRRPSALYARVPKDARRNLRYRKRVLQLCRTSSAYRKAVLKKCSQDILFWANTFVWTYDPRTRGKHLPFVSWEVQDEVLLEIAECIDLGEDYVIEKSRDMGASWCCLIVMLWHVLFHRGYSFLLLSRKEKLVDSPGDMDALFPKLRFMLKNMPKWMLPALVDQSMHLGNPELDSSIDGDATTKAAAVGGRRSAIFLDEFSRVAEGFEILKGTADVTRCRIFNFTPYGTGNAAYTVSQRQGIRKAKMHWSRDPRKTRGMYRWDKGAKRIEILDKTYKFPANYDFQTDGKFPLHSVWFDAERKRRANDREISEMLEIDYQGSSYQFFDKAVIEQLIDEAQPWLWEGDVETDRETGRPLGLVAKRNGPLKLWTHLDPWGRPPHAPYVAGTDVSYGLGATNSCWTLGNAATRQKIAEYCDPDLEPAKFAEKIFALCLWFKDDAGSGVLLSWEHKGPGFTFAKRIKELGYGRLYHRPVSELTGGMSVEPGWHPTKESKRLILEEYRSALSNREFINPSKIALQETLAFINTKTRDVEHSEEGVLDDPTKARENHGDRVIADAQCWKLIKETGPALRERNVEALTYNTNCLAFRRRMVENMAKSRDEY